jgi:hypothetical protein
MIAKELRALLPLFAASVATMVLASRLGREFVPMAVPAFLLGSAALGAWSIGHEYSHRTLGALLTLPVPRARIWTTKLAVTAPMLVALALVALWVFSGASQQSGVAVGMATYFLPTIAALCITPWLTMASRSAVGGALFTTSIAAIFVIAGDWIGIRKYGYTRDVDAFRMQFLWWTMGALSVIGAVYGWRMFSRLQAIDGGGTAFHLRFGRGAAEISPTAVRRHTCWLLIKKELRLQQLSWIVAAIYALIYVAVVVARRGDRDADNYVTLITIVHGMVQAMLVGSLASAEERHTGMHDTQLLLPVSSARQWMMKAAVTMAHAAVLTIALPLLLSAVLPVNGVAPFGRHGFVQPKTIAGVMALTCLCLYVSTLTASGLRALMLSIPLAFAVLWFVMKVGTRVSWEAYKWYWVSDGTPMAANGVWMSADRFFRAGNLAIGALILWRALAHYRWSDRRPARLAADAAIVAAAILAYFALSGLLRLY